MTLEDVEAVFDIEKTAHITPWSQKIIYDCVAVGYSCYVLTIHDVIHGFMIVRGTKEQCHLLNLCIRKDSQNQGLGTALLTYLIDIVKKQCASLCLEVRVSNLAAIYLYEKYGFKQIDCKKNYYADEGGTYEDAIVLELTF